MSNEERQQDEPVIRLGISTCLLGERVRYDGGHKLDRFLVQTLGRYFEWVPVCPEVEMGLPVPRESMRLEGDPADPRLVASRSGTDHTEAMKAWAQCRVDELAGDLEAVVDLAVELLGVLALAGRHQLVQVDDVDEAGLTSAGLGRRGPHVGDQGVE